MAQGLGEARSLVSGGRCDPIYGVTSRSPGRAILVVSLINTFGLAANNHSCIANRRTNNVNKVHYQTNESVN